MRLMCIGAWICGNWCASANIGTLPPLIDYQHIDVVNTWIYLPTSTGLLDAHFNGIFWRGSGHKNGFWSSVPLRHTIWGLRLIFILANLHCDQISGKFLSKVGGSLGLWLGMGALQASLLIIQYASIIFNCIMARMKRSLQIWWCDAQYMGQIYFWIP